MADVRARVIVEGRVQGVFFRACTREQAESLGIKGWVRNKGDGTVEAIFEGQRDTVQSMIEWCHHGPPYARVREVTVSWEKPDDGLTGFSIRH